MSKKNSRVGWNRLDLKKRSEVNWSSWHQGFYYNPNIRDVFRMSAGTDRFNNVDLSEQLQC